jgi:hypothetical protein
VSATGGGLPTTGGTMSGPIMFSGSGTASGTAANLIDGNPIAPSSVAATGIISTPDLQVNGIPWFDVMAAGAKCDSNGTHGNGTNDRAAIQALFASLPATGGKVIIPAGHICRIASTDTTINTDYLAITVGKLEITGGGTLFFDPVLVSGHPTFGGVSIVATNGAAGLQIYSPGCALTPLSDPEDITSGRSATTLISNINLHDFSLTSVGSYNSLVWNGGAEPTTNIPLHNSGVAVFCANNVGIRNLSISNFYTDAIAPWGIVGLAVTGNQITNVGFNGIGAAWGSDAVFSNNEMNGIGQGMEINGLRSTETGNTISKFAMSGIMVSGGPSANTNISTTIADNSLTRDPALTAVYGYGVHATCNGATSTCVDNLNIGPNTIVGALASAIHAQPGTVVSIHDNTAQLTAATGGTAGIELESTTGWALSNPGTILHNNLSFPSGAYYYGIIAALYASAGVNSVVKNNTINAASFATTPADGIYLYSSGLACQQFNYSLAATALDSGCPASFSTSALSDWTNTGVANGNAPVWNSSTGKWTPTGVYYQTVQANGSAQVQEPALDLISGTNATVACVDDSGVRTKCTVSATGGSSGGLNGTVTYTSSQSASTSDNGKLVIMNCSGACAYTLPTSQPSTTWNAWIISIGSTTATIVLGGSDTFNGSTNVPVLNRYRVLSVWANTATSTDYEGDAPLVASTNVTFIPSSNGMAVSATGTASAVPTVVDTSTPVTVSATNPYEYHFNENATAATAITYDLPTAAAGKQFCFSNSYNGSAANTGTLKLLTSASGQYIIFTDGTLSATGGYVISAGAAADAACVAGVDSTHWILYVQRGTWTKY